MYLCSGGMSHAPAGSALHHFLCLGASLPFMLGLYKGLCDITAWGTGRKK